MDFFDYACTHGDNVAGERGIFYFRGITGFGDLHDGTGALDIYAHP